MSSFSLFYLVVKNKKGPEEGEPLDLEN